MLKASGRLSIKLDEIFEHPPRGILTKVEFYQKFSTDDVSVLTKVNSFSSKPLNTIVVILLGLGSSRITRLET